MVPVSSLLNPSPPSSDYLNDSGEASSRSHTPAYTTLSSPPKKQKMSKAAATFVKGKPKGEVNFPPFEVQDQTTAMEHQNYEVQPIGQISDYPKRIPYNSDKKTFQQKTGRDGFEGMFHSLPSKSHGLGSLK